MTKTNILAIREGCGTNAPPNPQLLVVIILLGQTKLGPPISIASQTTSLLNMQLSTHDITLQLKFQSVSTTQSACTQLVSNVQWIVELGIKNHREMSECFLYKVTIQNVALVRLWVSFLLKVVQPPCLITPSLLHPPLWCHPFLSQLDPYMPGIFWRSTHSTIGQTFKFSCHSQLSCSIVRRDLSVIIY